jgi:sugar/nucleoside kinase (ribokinase family)
VKLDDRGDRSFMFYRKPGADVLITSEEIKYSLIDEALVFHYGSVSMTDEPSRSATLNSAAYARKHNKLITYDPNLRRLLWKDESEAREVILEGMKYADIVKLSEEELEFVTGIKDISEGTSYLMDKFKLGIIFVTLGAEGCYYRTSNCTGSIRGFGVEVVDTTGAGDAFLGGVIYKLLDINKKISVLTQEEMNTVARFGNAVGALAATKKGTISIMPDLVQIENLLSKSK